MVARVAVLCTLALVLALVDYRLNLVGDLRSHLSYVTTPFFWVIDAPARFVSWTSQTVVSHRQLRLDNEALRSEALVLRSKIQRLSILEAENVRLRELLNSSAQVAGEVLIAELIGVSPDPKSHSVVINRGSDHGVFVGQAMLDAHGLMGQIIEVSPKLARAILITDATHAIPVQVNRNGVRAILDGTGRLDQMELRHVPATTDIQIGDLIASSGLGGRFPPGYPVGTVTSVARDPGQAFAAIRVAPRAQLDRSRHVLLVFSARENN